LNRLAAIFVVLLIGGTAAAFAYTQGLKQTKSPIVATKVYPHQFSPRGDGSQRVNIAFGLRRDDHVTLAIVGPSGDVVRTLFVSEAVPSGYHRFTWDGRDDAGRLVKDGSYKPRVDLDDADRTINLPNKIVLDTVPPRMVGASPRLSKDELTVLYRVDEQAHGLLFVGGTRVVKTNGYQPTGKVQVSLADLRRRGLSGQVAVGAVDLAGNVSKLRVLKLRIEGTG
jgi:flagellar hook capping protein FlgD